MDDADARKLTWPKFLRRIADSVVNTPTSISDCWQVPATKEDGYHESKLSADGSKGKYRTHRLLHILVQPEAFAAVQDRSLEDQAIHRCGRGKGSGPGAPCCINPHHIYMGDYGTNQDTKGCKYGAAFLCPHAPKCVWVHPVTGEYKPCRNDPAKRYCDCAAQLLCLTSFTRLNRYPISK